MSLTQGAASKCIYGQSRPSQSPISERVIVYSSLNVFESHVTAVSEKLAPCTQHIV